MGTAGVKSLTRTMGIGDLEAVLALEVASFAEPWPEEMFVDELSRDTRRYLVLEDDDGRIVGYGGLLLAADDAHVMTLAIDPGSRRRGFGGRLLLAMVDTAMAAGARHLTLEVRESNRAARELYAAFGFEEVGLRPRYYRSEDAVVMWAVDVDKPPFQRRLANLRERYS